MKRKVIGIFMAGMMTLSMLAGCTQNSKDAASSATQSSGNQPGQTETVGFDIESASVIKPTILGKIQTGNRVPTDDLFTPIWREKTKVEPTIVKIPDGQDVSSWFQLQQVGGTMPDIIAAGGIFGNPATVANLVSLNVLREITLDDIYSYMPRMVKRLENWGISVDEWYNANLEPETHKLLYIPGRPDFAATNLADEDFVKGGLSYEPYTYYFRDDILNMIFPNAKTEAELRQLCSDKAGQLTYEDVNDIPIYSLDDLYDYLTKVKELNIKVGAKSIVPAQLQSNNDAASIMWSGFSLPGLFWQDLGDRLYNDTSFYYFAATDPWKNYIKYLNTFYNKGLTGAETYIQKDDQTNSKVINGEYAVFQGWLPAGDARAKSVEEKRGYGFRRMDLFLGDTLVNEYQDMSDRTVRLDSSFGATAITTSVSDKDYPQILNCIDWSVSEEACILRAWGPSYFYTGEGKDRRFKPEYSEVQKWALTGVESEKDGIYYGIYPGMLTNSSVSDVVCNQEIDINGWGYEWTPSNVYQKDYSDPNGFDIDLVYSNVIRMHYAGAIKLYVQKPLGDDVKQAYEDFRVEENIFGEMKKTLSFDADGGKTATIKAIVGKPADFETNYNEYLRVYITPEFMNQVKIMGEKWLAYRKLYTEKYRDLYTEKYRDPLIK